MLNKLRLDQTKTYEKKLASEEISNMLVDFVKGNPYHLAIGAEQGNIDKWDDVVILSNSGEYIYTQVKRQTTPFSTDLIIRDTNRKGELRKLSTLDETFKSLGKRISPDTSISSEFWLELPESSIEIKNGLTVGHLRRFRDQIKSVTTADDLINLDQIDPNTHNIYQWLTNWCDFKSWDHILKAFNLLKLKAPGYEPDIDIRVKRNLSYIFKESEIEHVYSLILSYLDENSTFAGAIKPRQLLYFLREYMYPNIARWTLFQTDGSYWNISGIIDLEDNNNIERPSVIVPKLWAKDNPNERLLKIYGACAENCLVSESLMRLSLHAKGSFNILCSNKNSWENSIRVKAGGTLGVTEDDLNDLRILEGLDHSSPSESKRFTTIGEKEGLAKELSDEMYKATFKLIDSAILNKIQKMKSGDLRTEVESRWFTWKPLLENSVEEQRELFSKMLHPKAEGNSISGELRVGPKTVDLLSETLFLLLVVSVCLGDGSNQSWKSVTNNLTMTSVGLAYWSGPADGYKNVIEIDDDTGIGKLIENMPGQIIIIPKSALTDIEFFNDDISEYTERLGLLTSPSYPKILITKNQYFRKLLSNGNISELREYFQKKLDKYKNSIESSVKAVVNEVVV